MPPFKYELPSNSLVPDDARLCILDNSFQYFFTFVIGCSCRKAKVQYFSLAETFMLHVYLFETERIIGQRAQNSGPLFMCHRLLLYTFLAMIYLILANNFEGKCGRVFVLIMFDHLFVW